MIKCRICENRTFWIIVNVIADIIIIDIKIIIIIIITIILLVLLSILNK